MIKLEGKNLNAPVMRRKSVTRRVTESDVIIVAREDPRLRVLKSG